VTRRHLGSAALAVLVASAGLAGCSGGGSNPGSTGGAATEVTVWDRAGAEAKSRQAFFQKWNADQGKQLGIAVKYEPQATEKYEELVRLGFQTKRAPDVFHAPSAQMGGFVSAGWVQPLKNVVSSKVLDDAAAYLKPSSELSWGGKAYGVPSTTFTIRLFYNKDLFKKAGINKPPATFSEVEAAAKAITESSPGAAYGVGLPAKWVGFRQWIVDVPAMAADKDLAQNGLFNRSTGKFESVKYEPVVKHYRTLIEKGWAYPGASTLDFDTEVAAFGAGKIGMMTQSSSVAGVLQQLGSKVDVGVADIPVPDGTKEVRSPMNAGFPFAIASTTKHPEQSAKVFEALVGADMQIALAAGGTTPLSEAAWNSAEAKKNPLLQLLKPGTLDEQWPKNPGGVIAVEGAKSDDTVKKLILDPSSDIQAELSSLSQRYQAGYDAGVKNKTIDAKEFTG